MASGVLSTEQSNDIYRISALTYFNPVAGKAENGQNGIPDIRYNFDRGLYQVSLTMPDGKPEYWSQVNAAYCKSSGFKGAAFERRNRDGTVWLDENGAPQVIVDFAGNACAPEDLATAKKIVYGQNVDEYFNDRQEFMIRVAEGIKSRKENYNATATKKEIDPVVKIGGHSIGARAAAGAAINLEEKGIATAQTYLIEPVGAVQAIQQLSQKGMDPNKLANVISVRDKNPNQLQIAGGNQVGDNGMPGQAYFINTGLDDGINGHMAYAIANAARKGEKIVLDPKAGMTGEQMASKRQPLSEGKKSAAHFKADLFVQFMNQGAKKILIENFNGAAADERRVDASSNYNPAFNFMPPEKLSELPARQPPESPTRQPPAVDKKDEKQFALHNQSPGPYTIEPEVMHAQELMAKYKTLLVDKGAKIDLGPFGPNANGVDGKFGSMTFASVLETERLLGVKTPDGAITNDFTKRLENEITKLSASPAITVALNDTKLPLTATGMKR